MKKEKKEKEETRHEWEPRDGISRDSSAKISGNVATSAS